MCGKQVYSGARHPSEPDVQRRYPYISRGGNTVDYTTGTHIANDINYYSSIITGKLQGDIPVALYINKCLEELDVVARFRIQRAQSLPL